MKFTLKIDSKNDAMTDIPEFAVADLLVQTARSLRNDRTSGTLKDINGNDVGSWKLTT